MAHTSLLMTMQKVAPSDLKDEGILQAGFWLACRQLWRRALPAACQRTEMGPILSSAVLMWRRAASAQATAAGMTTGRASSEFCAPPGNMNIQSMKYPDISAKCSTSSLMWSAPVSLARTSEPPRLTVMTFCGLAESQFAAAALGL